MEVLFGLPPLHLQGEAEARIGNCRLRCNDQREPKSEGFVYAYMTQDMKKEPILCMFMINPSLSDFLIEVNGKRGFNLTEKGD
jgi:hypothetical protein